MTTLDLLYNVRLSVNLTDGEKYIATQPLVLFVAEALGLYASNKRRARDRIILIWLVFAIVGAATGFGLLFLKL
jgi:hypothetical protein